MNHLRARISHTTQQNKTPYPTIRPLQSCSTIINTHITPNPKSHQLTPKSPEKPQCLKPKTNKPKINQNQTNTIMMTTRTPAQRHVYPRPQTAPPASPLRPGTARSTIRAVTPSPPQNHSDIDHNNKKKTTTSPPHQRSSTHLPERSAHSTAAVLKHTTQDAHTSAAGHAHRVPESPRRRENPHHRGDAGSVRHYQATGDVVTPSTPDTRFRGTRYHHKDELGDDAAEEGEHCDAEDSTALHAPDTPTPVSRHQALQRYQSLGASSRVRGDARGGRTGRSRGKSHGSGGGCGGRERDWSPLARFRSRLPTASSVKRVGPARNEVGEEVPALPAMKMVRKGDAGSCIPLPSSSWVAPSRTRSARSAREGSRIPTYHPGSPSNNPTHPIPPLPTRKSPPTPAIPATIIRTTQAPRTPSPVDDISSSSSSYSQSDQCPAYIPLSTRIWAEKERADRASRRAGALSGVVGWDKDIVAPREQRSNNCGGDGGIVVMHQESEGAVMEMRREDEQQRNAGTVESSRDVEKGEAEEKKDWGCLGCFGWMRKLWG